MDGSIHSVYMEKEAKTSLYGEKRSSMYILVQKKKKINATPTFQLRLENW